MSALTTEQRLKVALHELDEARNQLRRHPQWGNCKRGCAPAYLLDGFCSPACAMGAPRGEFVTLPKIAAPDLFDDYADAS